MRPRALSLLVVFFLTVPMAEGLAAPASDPAAFVDQLIHQDLLSLSDTQLSDQEREQRFAAILDRDFDLPRIARFVLGPYWNSAAEPDRQDFVNCFKRWTIHTYSSRFNGYNGNSVKITSARPESDTMFTVVSQVIFMSGAPPMTLDWRVRGSKGDGYKVVDVEFAGISLLLVQRAEFGSFIARSGGTIAGLTHALEEKIATGNTGGAILTH